MVFSCRGPVTTGRLPVGTRYRRIMTELHEKVDQYEQLLAKALEVAAIDPTLSTERAADGEECLEMARAYLADGRHFREQDDPVNALIAFSYGHGWVDAGARLGVLAVPEDDQLFAT